MKWLQAEGNPRLIVVSSSESVARSLRSIDSTVHGLLVEPSDGLLGVVDALGRHSGGLHGVCIDGALQCAGAPGQSSALWLCRQIRLTTTWTTLQRAWLMVMDHGRPGARLQVDAEWVFMYSRGCRLVPVWQILAELNAIKAEPNLPLKDESEVKVAISRHAFVGGVTRATASHEARNDRGWTRLARELAPPTGASFASPDDSSMALDQALLIDAYLHPESPPIVKESLDALRTRVQAAVRAKGLKFGLFDDQQDLGWRNVLRWLLFDDNSVREGAAEPDASTSRLKSVRFAPDALAYFEEGKAGLESVLNTWAETVRNVRVQQTAERVADLSWRQAQRELEKATKSLEDRQAALQAAEGVAGRELASFKSSAEGPLDRIAECATGSADKRFEALLTLVDDLRGLAGAVAKSTECIRKGEEAQAARDEASRALASARDREKRLGAELGVVRKDVQDYQQRLRLLGKSLDDPLELDVLFLDLRLAPEADRDRPPRECSGARVLAEVRRTFPFLPVVMLTASARAETATLVRELGADGYWIKDVSTAEDLLSLTEIACKKASVHKAWLQLQRLLTLKEACRFQWESSRGLVPKPWPHDSDRGLVHRLLEGVCATLAESTELRVVGRTPPEARCRQALLDLGLIQELRLQGVRDELWRKSMPLPEQELRNMRNAVTHKGAAVDFEQALGFLHSTLKRLLQDPWAE